MNKKIEALEITGGKILYTFYCPGCKGTHSFDSSWTFNDNYDKPTVTPSILVDKNRPERRCHSFITDGNIKFLGDCFHEFKNTTVRLEDIS